VQLYDLKLFVSVFLSGTSPNRKYLPLVGSLGKMWIHYSLQTIKA